MCKSRLFIGNLAVEKFYVQQILRERKPSRQPSLKYKQSSKATAVLKADWNNAKCYPGGWSCVFNCMYAF